MENKISVGANLKKVEFKKKEEKQHEPYLLPCGNEKEYCFLKVRRNNAFYCRTWKKIIWGRCRHKIETPQHQWKEYGE